MRDFITYHRISTAKLQFILLRIAAIAAVFGLIVMELTINYTCG